MRTNIQILDTVVSTQKRVINIPMQAVKVMTICLMLGATVPMFAQASGASTYTAKCQMCHGADGMGNTPAGKAMKAIPFNDPQILNQSDADLIAATKNGKGKMPAYSGKLSDGDIKSVIAYVHTLQKK
ncbi:c-type cytochrome [Acidicapsa ligni]|uniref:c-type cytochrome n=1 Tax=Acidicapsa ligni TaxID=542300 RepID=UPI0021E07741|nr:cytochrome c [Acidicapsa ligni]